MDGTGLSIGATRLAAVVVERTAVTRVPVLTLFSHRPPEVGVPSENPNLTESGLIVADYVDRVGDPVGIVAADGTSHRAEELLSESLRALLRTVAVGLPAGPVAVSHPAHWGQATVDALRAVLAGAAEFQSTDGPLLIADTQTVLTALARDPGVPTRGVIAVCDFGGTGTSLTFVEMAQGAQVAPLAPTVRHPDLSGDVIDQALLKHVIDGLSAAGAIDLSGTSAIGALSRLRAQCRTAKERLSTSAVAALTADLPGLRTDLRITRDELDEILRSPLQGFAEVIQEELERNGIRPGDLAAVASVGGGARIPAVTATLSQLFRVPVITTEHPELTAAIGAGLHSVRAAEPDGVTSVASVASPTDSVSRPVQALAWSDADGIPDVAPAELSDYDEPPEAAADIPRPIVQFVPDGAGVDPANSTRVPWYRRPLIIAGAAIGGALVVLGSAATLLMRDDQAPATTPPPVTTAPAPSPLTTTPGPPDPSTMIQVPPATVTQPAPLPPGTATPQPMPAPVLPPSAEQPPPVTPPPAESPPAEPPAESPPVEPPAEPPPAEPPAESPPVEPPAEPPPAEPPAEPPPAQPPPIEGPVITIPGLPPIPLFPVPAQPAP